MFKSIYFYSYVLLILLMKNYRKHYFILILLFHFSLQVRGQETELNFERINDDKSFSQSIISSIEQSDKGFIWFGTGNGLIRYDGYNFIRHVQDKNIGSSLSNNHVNVVFEDKEKRLWVGTNNGLNLFNKNTSKFLRIDIQDEVKGSVNYISSIIQDNQLNILVGTFGGVKRFNPKTNLLDDISKDANSLFKNCRVLSLFNDELYGVFVGTSKGLLCFDSRSGALKELPKIFQNNKSFVNSKIWKIVKEKNGDLWFATETKGAFLYAKTKNILINYTHNYKNPNSLASNWVNDILVKENNTVWFATKEGLSVFNKTENKFTNYIHNTFSNSSLTDNDLKCFLQDKFGSIWLGTLAGGINFYNKANSNFINISETIKPNFGLNNSIITGVVEDFDESLWLGTYGGGLNYLDFKNKKSSYFLASLIDGEKMSNLITVLTKRNNETLLCGTFNGLYEFNKKNKKFKNILLSPNKKNEERPITSLTVDGLNIWVGTNGNGLKKVLENGTVENYLADGQTSSISDNFITDIENSYQRLWLATQFGLNIFDKKLNKVTSVYKTGGNYSISSNTLTCLFTDSKGRLWIGTDYDGLNYFDEATQRFYVINESLGLYKGVVKSVSEDKEGNLWVSCDNLLYKIKIIKFQLPFSIDNFEVTSYSSKEGINTKQFSANCSMKISNDKLVFGGFNGLNVFSPENIVKLPNENEIVLTKLMVNNEEVQVGHENLILKNSISETSEINLNYDQGFIGVEFSALNYVNPESNVYEYQLENSLGEDNWYNIGTQHTINLSNLEYGNYVLKIKTSNEVGIWNSNVKQLRINISPPWWKTWWAYLIYLSLLLVFAGIVYRFTKNRIALKRALFLELVENERQQELSQMKLEFFTNISHEFRTPLTLINGPVEELMLSVEKNTQIERKLKTIKQNSDRLLKLINELMDFRKAEKGQMKIYCKNQDIIPFCFEVYESFKGIAVEKNIDYKFVLNVNSVFVYFDQNQLEKVIYNLLSNAFKFTKKNGKIVFSVELKSNLDDQIEIKIKDNGIGIPEVSKKNIFTRFFQVNDRSIQNSGTGVGLALSKSIVELHGGDISLSEEEEETWATTVFKISLLLGFKHLDDFKIVKNKGVLAIDDTPSVSLNSNEIVLDDENDTEDSVQEETLDDNRKTLLIIDDNKEVLCFLKDILKIDYRVLKFENAIEALKFMELEIPDLIISDVMMPEMDGYELCKIVKTNQSTNHIPIILLTAKSSTDHKIEGLSTGADSYITKPFSIEVLKLNVINLLNSKDILRQKYSGSFIVDSDLGKLTTPEEVFIKKLMEIIELNIENSEFDVSELVKEIGMSRTVLYKKVQTLTNHSVASLIKHIRLKKAADILTNTSYPVSEVTYMVGFNDRKHFSREFKKVYNLSPSVYKNSQK